MLVAGTVVLLIGLCVLGEFVKEPPAAKPDFQSSMNTYLRGYDRDDALARRSRSPRFPYVTRRVVGPVLVVDPDRRRVDEKVQSKLPTALRARDPANVGTAVWVDRYEVDVGGYSNGANAYRSYVSLTYIDVYSGRNVGEEDLRGADPPGFVYRGAGHGRDVPDKDIAKSISNWVTRMAAETATYQTCDFAVQQLRSFVDTMDGL